MKTQMSDAQKQYLAGQKLKELDDGEIIETGTGPAPKSRGRTYPGIEDFPTDQTGAEDADINTIMRRYQVTGKLSDLIAQGMQSVDGLMYGDFSDPKDLQESLAIVAHAEEQFMLLDAPVRNRFDNDPVKFLEFMNDPNNHEEHVKMGLRLKTEPKATLDDVVKTLKETSKPPKKATKGETTNDEE